MPMSLTGVKEVPEIAWEYWGLVSFMLKCPGLYTCDSMRTDCHDRLCEHYGLSKEQSRTITDRLDKFRDAAEMHFALKELAADAGGQEVGE